MYFLNPHKSQRNITLKYEARSKENRNLEFCLSTVPEATRLRSTLVARSQTDGFSYLGIRLGGAPSVPFSMTNEEVPAYAAAPDRFFRARTVP